MPPGTSSASPQSPACDASFARRRLATLSRLLTALLLAISDDDMSDVEIKSDVLPKKPRKSYNEPDLDEFNDEEDEIADTKPTRGAGGNSEDDDEENGEDLDDDEYVVEKIFSHYIAEDVRLSQPPNLHIPGHDHDADDLSRANHVSKSNGKAGIRSRIVPGSLKRT